jgi:protein-disulfide isomerase
MELRVACGSQSGCGRHLDRFGSLARGRRIVSLSIPVGGDDHAQGPADADVTLVEYGDYQCPGCGAAYPMVKAIMARLGAKLRFVFRNMPLNEIHPFAEMAAEAAEAAGAQGKFWEMHDGLYEHQVELGPELMSTLAKRLHLDVPRFEQDLVSHKFRDHVKRDFMGGVRSGVNGTPTFFIDSARYDGVLDEESLETALRQRI